MFLITGVLCQPPNATLLNQQLQCVKFLEPILKHVEDEDIINGFIHSMYDFINKVVFAYMDVSANTDLGRLNSNLYPFLTLTYYIHFYRRLEQLFGRSFIIMFD